MLTSEQFSTKYPDATTVWINSDLAFAIASESESDLATVCQQLKIHVESVQAKLFYLQLGRQGAFVPIFEDGYQHYGYCEWSETQGNLLELGFIPDDGEEPIDYIEYQVGIYFLSALINGDHSGLEPEDDKKLLKWLDSENPTNGHWHYDPYAEIFFDRCDITHLWCDVVDLLWIKR